MNQRKNTPARQQAQSGWIPVTHADRVRELNVANHYLCIDPDKIEAAQVSERDFIAIPILGVWWGRALELKHAGREWTIVDITVGGIGEYGPEWNGWMQQKTLLDWVIDATTGYAASSVPSLERGMLERALLRDVMMEFASMHHLVHENEATTDDILDRTSRLIDRLRARNSVGWVRHAEAVKAAALEYCEAAGQQKQMTLPMPWAGLQNVLDGWPLGRLIMMQAITSGHKTTAGRQAAEHTAKLGTPTAYITFEDPPKHLAARSMSAENDAKFSVRDLMVGNGDEPVMRSVIQITDRLVRADIPLHIRHQKMTLAQLLARLHEAAAKGCKLVVIDFFQLLLPDRPGESTTDFLARAANAIQGVASEEQTGMCVILLVQPTQEATKKVVETGHVLGTGDMRGGSAIAQAAFGVLSLGFDYADGKRVPGWITIHPQKWKTASTLEGVRLRLDAAHDRISDDDGSQAALPGDAW